MKRIAVAVFLSAISLFAQKPLGGGSSAGGSGGASGQYSTASVGYTTAAPYFFPPGGGLAASTTEANVQGKAPVAGTISNFTASLSASPGANTITFTWRDGGVDQALTCAITGANTSCSDTTHNFPVAVGDLLDIKAVATTGTVTAAVVFQWATPGVAGPTGAAGATGNFAPPYYTTTITASPMSITAATHGQGVDAIGICYDASTNPQIQSDCQWSRNPATGDLTLTYSVAPGAIQIGSGGAAANPLTTKGDLVGYSTAVGRVGVGSDGTFLTADSTQAFGWKWSPFTLSLSGNLATTGAFNTTFAQGGTTTQTLPTTSQTIPGMNQANTAGSSMTLDLSAASVTGGLKVPSAAGAAPTADGFLGFNTTNHTPAFGSNGSTLVPAIAATGTGTATTCSNQVVSAVSAIAVPTCHTVVGTDFGSSVTARSGLSNATAAAAAPTFSTTEDRLAYQTAEIPAYVFVTSTFTTSGSGTALEAITGLTWTMPGSTALNIPFHCALVYHQNSANAAVAFGFQNATTGATNLLAFGRINTSATVFAEANVANTTATTATSVVSGTPSAITTNWNAYLDGMIEQPSGTASVFTIRVSTATAADTVTVLRGSYCRVG